MTQFEKVKQMTVEEFVDEYVSDCFVCSRCAFDFTFDDCRYQGCQKGYIEYLKSEVEEDESI